MRGEHAVLVVVDVDALGIIPACAGSTKYKGEFIYKVKGSSPHARGAPIWWWAGAPASRDHPRMRGEHT